MQISEYKNIYKNEDSHFFYVANHNIILTQVKRFLKVSRSKSKILDAGCGTGLLAKKLKVFGNVQAIDISPEAVKFSKKRGINVKLASVNEIPFRANEFDLVVSMDVLYHKKVDDIKALREFNRVLKPGGLLIVRVSANKSLHLKHDKHVHTRQRYTLEEISKKIQTTGFLVEKATYVNMSLLPFAFIKQFVEDLSKNNSSTSGVEMVNGAINKVLLFVLGVENFLLSYFNLPFGLGIVVVAEKPI